MQHDERAAIAAFALEMSSAYARLAEALGGGGRMATTTTAAPMYGPATMKLPWSERVLRQCLILDEICAAGGHVAQTTWYEIAGKYGYSGRGLAGFFRGNGQGLLDLRKNGQVHVTKHGRERLAANRDRVAVARAEQAALAGA